MSGMMALEHPDIVTWEIRVAQGCVKGRIMASCTGLCSLKLHFRDGNDVN